MRGVLTALTVFAQTVIRVASRLVPKNANLVVCGAHYGTTYSSNPRHMFEFLVAHTAFRCVWIGKPEVRDSLPDQLKGYFVCRGSLKSTLLLLLAKYWVFDHDVGDMSSMDLYGGAVLINLFHGIPLKRMGINTQYYLQHRDIHGFLHKIVRRIYNSLKGAPKYYISVSNEKMASIMVESSPSFSMERMIRAGSPRNDYLIRNADNDEVIGSLKRKFCQWLGIPEGKRIVLYMPTWRMTRSPVFSFSKLSGQLRETAQRILREHNAVILEKPHPYTYDLLKGVQMKDDCFVVCPSEINRLIDPQELYLISDVMITDYSSSYIDFALMKRPCLHFAYDLEEYDTYDSGLAYDYKDVVAGPIVKDTYELIKVLENALETQEFAPANGFAQLVEYENGCAAKRIYEEMVLL